MAKLKNGSICYSLPAGKTGVYLRSFTIDFLYIDEAAYVPDPVYNSLVPMLAVPKNKGLGWECLLSTPFGKGGFFYDSFTDDDYLNFHVSSEDCKRVSKSHLIKEEKRLSRLLYAQEYKGEFIDEFRQFFSTDLIKDCMTFMRWVFEKEYNKANKYFLGVDIARYGEDETAYVMAEMPDRKKLKIVEVEISEKKNLMDTAGRIMKLDEEWNFNRIFIDDAGLGAGVTDLLLEKLGRKIVGINNSKKAIDHEGERQNKILKEDLYSNAKVMMEKGDLDILDNPSLLRSLKCMTYEYTSEKTIKISGKYSHLAEAFVRACWAVKTKSLNLYVY
jgi:hypothetical protein